MNVTSASRTIVLLQPRVGDMDDFRDHPTPPMALLHAATFVADRYDVQIVDQRVENGWRERLRDLLASRPVAVGVTAMSGPMIGHALEMVAEVRKASDVPVVWGGTHVTLRPEQSIASPAVDYMVLGEGEHAFAALADRLAAGKRGIRGLPGVWARSAVRNPRPEVLDFAALPLAPYRLVDYPRYMYTHRGLRNLDYLSSRGCPHRCSYCYNNVFFSSRWSAKSAAVVEAELKELRSRYEFDAVYFLDDNFFIDRKRAFGIATALWKMGLRYEIQGVDIQTIAALSDEELAFLEESGLIKITIGIESASDRIRALIGKWKGADAAHAALRKVANRRFLVLTSFILGFPGETQEEMDRTIGFALDLQRLGANFRLPQFYNYTPIPGTRLAQQMEDAGLRFPETLEEYSGVDWDHFTLDAPGSPRRRRMEAIAFLSKFIDRKHEDYGARWFVSRLYEMYRPVALARLRLKAYDLLVEKPLYSMLKRLA